MPEDTEQMTLRLRHTLRDDLDNIAEYTGALSATELVRGWAVERVGEFKRERGFNAFVERKQAQKKDLLQQKLIA